MYKVKHIQYKYRVVLLVAAQNPWAQVRVGTSLESFHSTAHLQFRFVINQTQMFMSYNKYKYTDILMILIISNTVGSKYIIRIV